MRVSNSYLYATGSNPFPQDINQKEKRKEKKHKENLLIKLAFFLSILKGDRILNIKIALLSSSKFQIQALKVNTISKCTLLTIVSGNILTEGWIPSILLLLLKMRLRAASATPGRACQT